MVLLNDLIQIHENSLEKNICEILTTQFDSLVEHHERVENDRKPNFTQLNLTELVKDNIELNSIHQHLIKKTIEYKNIYYDMVDSRCFPLENAFEQFRIKVYDNNQNDAFDCHVDVTDHNSSRRFLSFMWYLNDVDSGGETVFEGLTIKPEVGKLVIFPPLWMFPHIGKPPLSSKKYIVSTYLHYK